MALAVPEFMRVRGIDVPEAARERITTCTDLDQHDTWVRRVVTISTVDELFV